MPSKAKKDDLIFCQKDKLAILGTADTLPMAPWEDLEYEIWSVAVVTTYPVFKRADLLFEMHTGDYWKDKNVIERMKKFDGPTYMQEKNPEIPKSRKFPLEILTQAYRPYYTSSIAYMLAWAYHSFLTTQKPWHVGLWGIHMSAEEEYENQRPGCEYWLGRMEAAGMDIMLAPGGDLLTSMGLYAYENYKKACVLLRERVEGLRAGERHFEAERNNMEGHRWKQIGAAEEAERLLRMYQRGEL